jgi:hypothetical protein
MAYREKAEVPDYIVDDPDVETSTEPSPPPKPENPWIWGMLILLALEVVGSYFFKFSTDSLVVSAAANVVLGASLRINHLLGLRLEKEHIERQYERFACKALTGIIDKMKDAPGLPSVIQEHNRNKLTYPEAMKVSEYVSGKAHNA